MLFVRQGIIAYGVPGIPVEWEQAFGGNTALTSAMLDRLLHHAHVIQIRGDSYRLKEKRRSGILGQQLTTVQIDD
jgi:hypothetical protein